jgi:hypothetical protein
MMASISSNLFKQNINQYTKAVPINKNPNPYQSHKEKKEVQNNSSTKPSGHHSSLFADYDKPQCITKKQEVPCLNLNKCNPTDSSGSATHREQLYERNGQALIPAREQE